MNHYSKWSKAQGALILLITLISTFVWMSSGNAKPEQNPDTPSAELNTDSGNNAAYAYAYAAAAYPGPDADAVDAADAAVGAVKSYFDDGAAYRTYRDDVVGCQVDVEDDVAVAVFDVVYDAAAAVPRSVGDGAAVEDAVDGVAYGVASAYVESGGDKHVCDVVAAVDDDVDVIIIACLTSTKPSMAVTPCSPTQTTESTPTAEPTHTPTTEPAPTH